LQLDSLRAERQAWFTWKNIASQKALIDALPTPQNPSYTLTDSLNVDAQLTPEERTQFLNAAKALMPWRKGPFTLCDTFIDTEWRSNIKYDLIEPHLSVKDKIVADVGCNNGYYMFRLLAQNPKRLVGFDPSPLFNLQFELFDKFVHSGIIYELLGIEHLEFYEHKFDIILCLGVLYHRSDPIASLKSLAKALNKRGEIIIDTLIIQGDDELCLFPKDRYAAMRNVYFLPTIPALKNWLYRAGFEDIEVIAVKQTDFEEQRKTEWIGSQSLNNFLQSDDMSKTVEGYPAPLRGYLKARKA